MEIGKYFIVEKVTITKANELLQFEVKLPGTAKRVIGYQITASKSDDSKVVASVGIAFNGSRENTINRDLIQRSPNTIRRRYVNLTQNQVILQNSYVQGFVEDMGVVDPEYTVKIYFYISEN